MTGTTLLKGVPPEWADRKDAAAFLEMALLCELRRIRGSVCLGKALHAKSGFVLTMRNGKRFRIVVTKAKKED